MVSPAISFNKFGAYNRFEGMNPETGEMQYVVSSERHPSPLYLSDENSTTLKKLLHAYICSTGMKYYPYAALDQ